MHIARYSDSSILAGLGMTIILFHNFLGFLIIGTNTGYISIAGCAFDSN